MCRSLCDLQGPSRTSTAFSVLTEGGNELDASSAGATETLQLEWEEEGEDGTFDEDGVETAGAVWPGMGDTREPSHSVDGLISDDEPLPPEAESLDLATSSDSLTPVGTAEAVGGLEAADATSQLPAPNHTKDSAGLSTVIQTLKRDFDTAFSAPSFEPEPSLSPFPKHSRSLSPSLPPASTRVFPAARSELPPPIRPASPTQAEMDAFFGFVNPLAALPPVEDYHCVALEGTVAALAQEVAQEATSPRAATLGETPPAQQDRYAEDLADPADSSAKAQKSLAIISSLEQLALSVLSQIVDNVVPPTSQSADASQAAKHPPWRQVRVVLAKRGSSKTGSSSRQTIRFPRKYGQGDQVRLGGKELACFLRLVELVLEGLRDEKVPTKRDLYYRDVALFGKQTTVNSLIDDLAATLDVRRSELNIIAAAKGLVAGTIKFVSKDGTEQSGRDRSLLIPVAKTLHVVEADAAEWLLVIEKEAVFQSLASSSLLDDMVLGNGIILTGKGYPDIATRDLLKVLSDSYPSLPLFALVDSDPHGLDILSTYRFGSAALSHESANLAVPRLEWLGVKGTEWDSLGVDRDELLPLSLHDRRKALAMLKKEGLPEEWRRELQYMLHLGCKAEIQILASSSSPTQLDFDTQIQSSASDSPPAASSRLIDYIKTKLRLALPQKERLMLDRKDLEE
ncbi:meiotic recombination protein SPO11 [Rhodotorula toruloides]|uniref:DNA topoisomerase (ATP-hydrolyzing) n=1 Tax=Rhodotorula toruloides TaxID=5286 RepID=A0A511KHJ2_RHOTO|nr:meiotic recombination protein SPO11 [Rhodotorula toruloides]